MFVLRGRDARRNRGETFGVGADLASLFGPRLSIASAGEVNVLGRRALRYTLALAGEVPEAAPPAETRVFAQGGPDPGTKVRLAFLDGAQAVSAPKDPLPDDRKPRGIADALERAGLRKKAEGDKKDEPRDAEP